MRAKLTDKFVKLQKKLAKLSKNGLSDTNTNKQLLAIQTELNTIRQQLHITTHYKSPLAAHDKLLWQQETLMKKRAQLNEKITESTQDIELDLLMIAQEFSYKNVQDIDQYKHAYDRCEDDVTMYSDKLPALVSAIADLKQQLVEIENSIGRILRPAFLSEEKRQLLVLQEQVKGLIKTETDKANNIILQEKRVMQDTLSTVKHLKHKNRELNKAQNEMKALDQEIDKGRAKIALSETACKDIQHLCTEYQTLFDNAYGITHEFYKENVSRMKSGLPQISKSDVDKFIDRQRDLLGALIAHLKYPSTTTIETIIRRFKAYSEMKQIINPAIHSNLDDSIEKLRSIDPTTMELMDPVVESLRTSQDNSPSSSPSQ